jgi:hypothetical protein
MSQTPGIDNAFNLTLSAELQSILLALYRNSDAGTARFPRKESSRQQTGKQQTRESKLDENAVPRPANTPKEIPLHGFGGQ